MSETEVYEDTIYVKGGLSLCEAKEYLKDRIFNTFKSNIEEEERYWIKYHSETLDISEFGSSEESMVVGRLYCQKDLDSVESLLLWSFNGRRVQKVENPIVEEVVCSCPDKSIDEEFSYRVKLEKYPLLERGVFVGVCPNCKTIFWRWDSES